MDIVADSHLHSTFSADGEDDIFSMCQGAIKKKLSYVTFTEHVDYNALDDSYLFFNYKKYTEKIEEAKTLFGDKITILKGIEFSEPHMYPKKFQKMIEQEFDLILASIHYVRTGIGFHWLGGSLDLLNDYAKKEIYHQYYSELLDVVKLGGFQVLAHFDNPKRYLKEDAQETVLIENILREMVHQDIGLEINTSALRKGAGTCSPDKSILQMYHDLGGRRITIGSDAHSIKDIASGYQYVERLLSDLGLEVGIYKNRKFMKLNVSEDNTQ